MGYYYAEEVYFFTAKLAEAVSIGFFNVPVAAVGAGAYELALYYELLLFTTSWLLFAFWG